MLVVTARQMFYRMKSCTPPQADLLVHPSENKAKLCQAAMRSHALTVPTHKSGTISVGIQLLRLVLRVNTLVIQPVKSLELERKRLSKFHEALDILSNISVSHHHTVAGLNLSMILESYSSGWKG